ncbi:response regulator [Tengunoibacter tsumagoiensis]|uniref:DNA-binding response regulator n=1 Tax=Tengunoibacter tsumagoiensis TaxID=2014871 RepID=A0A402A3H1_9CHLR|nr:response regulator transcription factor [Tengunoibacter tsumagoiensis]GCE13589.1 DNA-binding response regulator [Tengunoibacter tsumagoiensis]
METQKIINATIRILVVADHVILRQGIQAMLTAENDFDIVGEAGSGKAAIRLASELEPDIVLIDTSLEATNGLDIAHQLLRSAPNTRIVLFAGSNDEKLLFEALRIGVHGYLHKTLSINELREALRAVQRGERVLGQSQAVTQVLVEFHRLVTEQTRLSRGLSTTEIELVQLASKGYTNKEIGKQHFWSEVQVKRKMQEIYRKLQVTDRAQAVAEAMRQGLI